MITSFFKYLPYFLLGVAMAILLNVVWIEKYLAPLIEEKQPSKTETIPEKYQLYHVDCLEDGHRDIVVTVNPCLQYPYIQRDYDYVQVLPESFTQRFYPNIKGLAGGDVLYDAGYSLDIGYWSGQWSIATQPFLVEAEQCYLMIADFFADINNGELGANQNEELATNASLNMYLRVEDEQIAIGNHPTVKQAGIDVFTGNVIYNLKSKHRGMSAFWFSENTVIEAEFAFTVLWGLNIHETRLTFHDAYVVAVDDDNCNGVEVLP
jgi:hypothetical protein